MEDQLINLETAKLLKNKGFDIQCEYFYNSNSGYSLQNDSIIRTGDDDIYEAPTQSLVQKWLRETYGINIMISFKPNIKKWDFISYDMSMNGKEYVDFCKENYKFNNKRRYNTYEDALEAGIIESLNIIYKY